MRQIPENQLPFNTTSLACAERDRQFQTLPYSAKKLVVMFGIEPREAIHLAARIGWWIGE